MLPVMYSNYEKTEMLAMFLCSLWHIRTFTVPIGVLRLRVAAKALALFTLFKRFVVFFFYAESERFSSAISSYSKALL